MLFSQTYVLIPPFHKSIFTLDGQTVDIESRSPSLNLVVRRVQAECKRFIITVGNSLVSSTMNHVLDYAWPGNKFYNSLP